MSRPQSRFVRVDATNPSGAGQCDRCGFWYNARDLTWQYQYGGVQLYNQRILVCTTGNRCADKPSDFLRTIILPPDPMPLKNPRVPDFDYEEQTVRITTYGAGAGLSVRNPPWGAGPEQVRCEQTGEIARIIQYLTQSAPGINAHPTPILIPDGLIGYWPFTASTVNFTTGVVQDLSPTKNNGILNGYWPYSSIVQGPNSDNIAALNFSGISNITANCYTGLSSFSQCFWVKAQNPPSTANGITSVTSNGGDGSLGWAFSWDFTSNPGVTNSFFMQSISDLNILQANFDFSDPLWYFIVCIWDGSTMNVYVNSQLCGTISQFNSLIDVTGHFIIGGTNAFGRSFFTGAITGVRVYNRALSLSEIQALNG